MDPPPRLLAELDALSPVDPRDYFQGVRATELCQVDNLLVFLRTQRDVLRETGFGTRPHHRYVLILNFATAGTVNADGVAFRLHPGEAFLIAPYQLHFYTEVAAAEIRWVFFTFEAANRTAFGPLLNVPLALTEAEMQDGLRLAQACQRARLAGAGEREALILGFSLFLNRLKQTGSRRSPPLIVPPTADHALLERINRLLTWHLEDRLTIAALAGRLAISESHLRKRFRQLNGLSLGSYLLHYRLNRAIKLLVHSDLSLTQIAVECGYESLAAFSRSFRTKVGQTPSSFRKSGR
jgi:AraC-like DNA-binding protein